MRNLVAILGLLALVPFLVACGSDAEADLDRSPEELNAKAESMSRAELEQAVQDLEKLAEDWGAEMEGKSLEDLSGGDTREAAERLGKLMKVLMIYQLELQKKAK